MFTWKEPYMTKRLDLTYDFIKVKPSLHGRLNPESCKLNLICISVLMYVSRNNLYLEL